MDSVSTRRVYCGCGKLCGLWWNRTAANGARKYHPSCPHGPKPQYRKCHCSYGCGRRFLQQHARQRYAPDCPYKSEGAPSVNRKAAKRRAARSLLNCCAGLAHRRPQEHLCACGGAYAPLPELTIDQFTTNKYLPNRSGG